MTGVEQAARAVDDYFANLPGPTRQAIADVVTAAVPLFERHRAQLEAVDGARLFGLALDNFNALGPHLFFGTSRALGKLGAAYTSHAPFLMSLVGGKPPLERTGL